MPLIESSPFSVIVLAAGKGKRMNNPNVSKVMALVDNRPLINHVINQVLPFNPNKIVIIVGHCKESVIEYINSLSYDNIFFAEQLEQLGTGHAVAQTQNYFEHTIENVLILSGDVPLLNPASIKKFISNHFEKSADLSVLSSFTDHPKGYGRICRDDSGEFTSIVEEKDADEKIREIKEINSGIYFVNTKYLFESLDGVSNANAQGEYYLTDVVGIMKSKGLGVVAYPGAVFEELQGVNSPDDLKNVEEYYFMIKEKESN